ncbi:hypothetical protein N7G274_002716 [Stereocaulon virgatum]|uniref:Uncharacterized protein n=1 Tax=Stereocaulon virgatum TaxID=373712 RepID=A0ABR4AJF8_9LECA
MTDSLPESRLENNTPTLRPDDTASKTDASQNDQSLGPTSDMIENVHIFRKLWRNVTVDNYPTFSGFRQFKMAHLLNLRVLEDEISRTDGKIYQAELQLDLPPANMDNSALRRGKRDTNAP